MKAKTEVTKPVSKDKEKQQKKKFGRTGIILSVLGIFGVLSYCGADFHYKSKIDARYEQYKKTLKTEKWLIASEKKIVHEKRAFLPRKIKYIARLESMEDKVKKYHTEFIEFLKQNEDMLIGLTGEKYEISGYIEKSGDRFEIRRKTALRDRIIEYFSEVLDDNLSHKDELLRYYDLSPEIFIGIKKKEQLEFMLDIIETYVEYKRLPGGKSVILGYDKSGNTKDMTKDVRKLYEGGKRIFGKLKETMERISLTFIDDEFLDDDRIFSRFHTHPLDGPNFQPSYPDIASTYMGGPSILFSRKGGILHVYEIAEGNVKEIYKIENIKGKNYPKR